MSELVSVVIPTYNRKQMAVEAVESVLAQTYRPLEALVVDNGSDDGTAGALRRFGPEVRCIELSVRGLSNARNEGIRQAKGSLVALLDSDDLWMPKKLERQVPLFERPETAFVCSDVYYCRTPGRPVSRYFENYRPARGRALPELFLRLFMHPSSMVFRKSAVERSGLFDVNFQLAEEYDFAMRLAPEGDIDFVDEPLVWARLHGANESRQKRLRLWTETDAICERHARDPEVVRALGSRVEKRLCEIKVALAFEHLRAGEPAAAAARLRQALSKGTANALLRSAEKALALAGQAFNRLRERTTN